MFNTIIILVLLYIALSVTPFNRKHIANNYRNYMLVLIGILTSVLILVYFINLLTEIITILIINLF